MVTHMKVLITGATSGIGKEVAVTLAKRGHFVYLTTHTLKEAKKLKEEIKELDGKIIVFKLDITKPNDYKQLLSLDIDCLICHAGIGMGGSLLDLSLADIKKNFETNYFGTLALIKYLLPQLLKKEEGRIIVTSSVAGIIPIPFLGSYASTKAALSQILKIFRQELRLIPTNLQVSLIEPGIYNTGFNDTMLDYQKPLVKESSFFSSQDIQKVEKKIFHFLGKNDYHSIVKKFIKATESPHPKKVYRAPFLTRLGVKLYLLFFG